MTDNNKHSAESKRAGMLMRSLKYLALAAALNGPALVSAQTAADDMDLDALAVPTRAVAATTIKDIRFDALPGDKVQITIETSSRPQQPQSFSVDDPPRIALDFADTHSGLGWRAHKVGIGMVKSVAAIEAQNRTRIVFNLVKQATYSSQITDQGLILILGGKQPSVKEPAAAKAAATADSRHMIEHIDFRRGAGGEGRIVVNFSDPNVVVDVREEGHKIIADFLNAGLPETLQQRLDVIDFATPVQTIDSFTQGDNVRLVITPRGDYEHLAYQSDATLTIDVKKATKPRAEVAQAIEYKGEKLSLNFQDIEVRAVLQLLADFTGLNIVVSDSVKGNITLRLKNTPWDQALEIILKTKGLAKRRSDNVMLIAPSEEIAAREKLELEAQKQIDELSPLRAELIQINYAKAEALAELLKSEHNTLLSERGHVSIDSRTNTLLIRDTIDRLVEIRKLVAKLDIPIRQVLIESRIVIASDNFVRDLGARVGVTGATTSGSNTLMTSGTIQGPGGISGGTNNLVQSGGFDASNLPSAMNPLTGAPQRLNVNLPVASSNAGRLALAILRPNALLDLELSALQVEGRGEVVSNPRVITSNQKEALIEQGTEIPYEEASSSGATSIAFKKAVLSLRVTPQITPDDRVILDLNVTKDSVGKIFKDVPSIDTKEVATQVLVDNGETVVLGGIYEQVKSESKSKIPFLGDIPLLGALFRSSNKVNDKNELLIFVTPKILKDTLKLQ